jgi:hypothetical protein
VTLAEAAALVVDLLHDLSAARAETARLRELLSAALDVAHAQHVELTRLRARYHQLLNERRTDRNTRARGAAA